MNDIPKELIPIFKELYLYFGITPFTSKEWREVFPKERQDYIDYDWCIGGNRTSQSLMLFFIINLPKTF